MRLYAILYAQGSCFQQKSRLQYGYHVGSSRGSFRGFVTCHKDERRKKQNCIEIYTILEYTGVAFL